ncbi:MAG: SdpI family protein [Thermacetogeniaceae bacterium]
MSKGNRRKNEPNNRPNAASRGPGRKHEETSDYRVNLATLAHDWPILILLLVLVVASVLVFPHLPARVPGHWNVAGQVDRYTSRAFAAFFYPLLIIWIYLMMVLMPLIDPKRQNYARFEGAYRLLRSALVLFLSGTWAITILTGLGYSLNVGMIMKGGIGLLFLLIGSMMGQIRFNYFVGVKTPWTLADERVWQTTHHFAGRIWVLGSLLILLSATVSGDWGAILFIGIVAMLALAPIIFSYVEYNGLHKSP